MTGWLYIIPYITTAHFFNSGKNSRNIIVLFYIPLAQTVEDNAAKTGLMASQHDGQKKKLDGQFSVCRKLKKDENNQEKRLYETYLGFIVKCNNHS